MIYSDASMTEKIAVFKTALDKSEALIIGAGAGHLLSAIHNCIDESFDAKNY
jgi:hypothetical protein